MRSLSLVQTPATSQLGASIFRAFLFVSFVRKFTFFDVIAGLTH